MPTRLLSRMLGSLTAGALAAGTLAAPAGADHRGTPGGMTFASPPARCQVAGNGTKRLSVRPPRLYAARGLERQPVGWQAFLYRLEGRRWKLILRARARYGTAEARRPAPFRSDVTFARLQPESTYVAAITAAWYPPEGGRHTGYLARWVRQYAVYYIRYGRPVFAGNGRAC